MNMQKVISIRRLAVLILIVAACLLMVGGAQPVRPPTKQTTTPETGTTQSKSPRAIIKSRVRNLRPINIKVLSDRTIEVTLRNDCDKDITAVAASVNGMASRREYLVAELEASQKLARGATDSFLYEKPSTPDERLEILAVVFSDGTSEGDKVQIREILDQRQGMKIQLLRILPLLQRLGNASSATAPSEFATLKQTVESLPMTKDDHSPMSTDLEHGLRHGRAFILMYYVSVLEQALANEKVETWYDRTGQQHTARYSPYEHFRMKFEKILKDFTGLADRL